MTSFFRFLRPFTSPLLLAALVTYLACAHGIPLLRHDWGFPIAPNTLGPTIENLFSPWIIRGIGEPNPNATFYIAGFLLWPLTGLPPVLFVMLLVVGVSFLVAYAGSQIGRVLGRSEIASVACAVFALLNPWAYTELVAGHIFMLCAYGLLALLVAEILRERPRPTILTLLCALTVLQIEFFCFALIPLAIWLVYTRRVMPLVALFVAAVPIGFGILANYDSLRGTPYLLEWQVSQSVQILDALVLRGYFAHYDSAFASIAFALWLIAFSTIVAAILALIKRRFAALAVMLIGFAATCAATGTTWVLTAAYTAVVLHVPESGVFRELYDILAFGAIASAVGLALLSSLAKPLRYIVLAASMLLLYPWVTAPPTTWFVPQHALNAAIFPGGPRERVALFPSIQPLSMGSTGSGYDFDLFVQSGKAVPINTFFPRYPEIVALALAERGDYSASDALGVRYIISRPALRSNSEALSHTVVAPSHASLPQSQARAAAFPILGLLPGKPTLATLARTMDGNGVFFADAPGNEYQTGASWFQPIAAPRISANPDVGWIDARLAYPRFPQYATRLGGAFTSLTLATLSIPSAPYVLAWTSGKILNGAGNIVVRSSHELSWWPLPANSTLLQCEGECFVAGVGNRPVAPSEGPWERPTAVAFRTLSPWVLSATLPEHDAATLRWASRFDSSWVLLGAPSLAHLRLDQELNAWLLPQGPEANVYLVNVKATIQFLLEIASVIAIFALVRRAAQHA